VGSPRNSTGTSVAAVAEEDEVLPGAQGPEQAAEVPPADERQAVPRAHRLEVVVEAAVSGVVGDDVQLLPHHVESRRDEVHAADVDRAEQDALAVGLGLAEDADVGDVDEVADLVGRDVGEAHDVGEVAGVVPERAPRGPRRARIVRGAAHGPRHVLADEPPLVAGEVVAEVPERGGDRQHDAPRQRGDGLLGGAVGPEGEELPFPFSRIGLARHPCRRAATRAGGGSRPAHRAHRIDGVLSGQAQPTSAVAFARLFETLRS
jgi:hypothetical protein